VFFSYQKKKKNSQTMSAKRQQRQYPTSSSSSPLTPQAVIVAQHQQLQQQQQQQNFAKAGNFDARSQTASAAKRTLEQQQKVQRQRRMEDEEEEDDGDVRGGGQRVSSQSPRTRTQAFDINQQQMKRKPSPKNRQQEDDDDEQEEEEDDEEGEVHHQQQHQRQNLAEPPSPRSVTAMRHAQLNQQHQGASGAEKFRKVERASRTDGGRAAHFAMEFMNTVLSQPPRRPDVVRKRRYDASLSLMDVIRGAADSTERLQAQWPLEYPLAVIDAVRRVARRRKISQQELRRQQQQQRSASAGGRMLNPLDPEALLLSPNSRSLLATGEPVATATSTPQTIKIYFAMRCMTTIRILLGTPRSC
jgi:hypothetical protein